MMLHNSKTHDTDFHITARKAYFIIEPVTKAATEWLQLNTEPQQCTWWSGMVAIEQRKADKLIRNMLDSGLTVH